MKFLHSFILLLLLLGTLHAEKVLYLTYENPPTRVVQGEYFPLTIKLLSTIGQYNSIHYSFSHAKKVTLLYKNPSRVKKGNYYYDTFYFTASSSAATTPKITATLHGNSASLKPLPLEVVILNPKKNYANVVADSFKVTKYKTTVYDKENNIVVFNAKTLRCNLSKFKLAKVKKQGFETKRFGIRAASMTYYAVIPKKDDNLIFTYFNLRKQKFEKVVIPIIVDDDRVSTQSNLKPKESKHQKIKMIAAGVVLLIALGFLLFKRNIWFILLVIAPGYYLYITALPTEYVCIKANSPIQLLPMQNGTVFEATTTELTLEAQAKVGEFTKVQLQNKKIGWVKDENICTP
jgi:hypothetical protein